MIAARPFSHGCILIIDQLTFQGYSDDYSIVIIHGFRDSKTFRNNQPFCRLYRFIFYVWRHLTAKIRNFFFLHPLPFHFHRLLFYHWSWEICMSVCKIKLSRDRLDRKKSDGLRKCTKVYMQKGWGGGGVHKKGKRESGTFLGYVFTPTIRSWSFPTKVNSRVHYNKRSARTTAPRVKSITKWLIHPAPLLGTTCIYRGATIM